MFIPEQYNQEVCGYACRAEVNKARALQYKREKKQWSPSEQIYGFCKKAAFRKETEKIDAITEIIEILEIKSARQLKLRGRFIVSLLKRLIEIDPESISELLIKNNVIADQGSSVNVLKKLIGGFLPKNEMGTLLVFLKQFDQWFGEILEVRRDYPDLIVSDKFGFKKLRVELEYKSRNFIQHKHDPKGCDYVVCWEHNTKLPIPVIELKTNRSFNPNEK